MVIMTLSIGTRDAIYDGSLHSSLENKVKTSSGEGLSDVLLPAFAVALQSIWCADSSGAIWEPIAGRAMG